MTFEEMAWEFAEVFDELDVKQINEMLAKNIPLETLNFFTQYAADFSETCGTDSDLAERLPNLMLIGYLIRVLEERLLPEH
jgi:hypothetical protein